MMDWTESLSRMGLALLLTFPIGWERETGHKPAGLRTLLLVSLGCCLFVLISLNVAGGDGRSDPGRIAAQTITGIGFLGGGAILRAGGAIRGLTTAASIWVVAAIGMACGAAYYPGAIVCAVAAFFVLTAMERWERRVLGAKTKSTIRLRLGSKAAAGKARETLFGLGFKPDAMSVEEAGEDYILIVTGAFSRQATSIAFEHLCEDAEFLGLERNGG